MAVKFHALSSLLVLLPACAISASACGTSSAQPCLPSRLNISPTIVPVGGTVVLASGPFACHASYARGKTYMVILGLTGRGDPRSLGNVSVNQNGSFRATLGIPSDVSFGQTCLVVYGSAFDTCSDTRDASCAGYASPALRLLPARQMPLLTVRPALPSRDAVQTLRWRCRNPADPVKPYFDHATRISALRTRCARTLAAADAVGSQEVSADAAAVSERDGQARP
jgi:hypothetical protein